MAGRLWNTIKGFGKNVVRHSRASNYINRAIQWGAIGGAVGGVAEWAQGGSFFEGAKSGAFTGAVVGAGYTAVKAGLAKNYGLNKSFQGKFTLKGGGRFGGVRGAGAAAADAAQAQATATKAAAGGAGVADAAKAAAQADATWMGTGRARVQAKLDAYEKYGRNWKTSVPSSNWSATAEMERLGLATSQQVANYRAGGGISKQVIALNQMYGDVRLARSTNKLRPYV